ncbi:MAG TPA: alpha/beta fold hydrolase [Gordonia sp. (in: high G+C Gram-positive bacteria)]|uniref:alpha/beta fold hydrolase n=1 Tax=unclassified Gordonia (in: high G+C Gram-positive bacteria) TaxID=2657482 RepID=UPI000F95A521|nr:MULTISPECIES: alpha/beta fold hydrolase [unclassified Gordonia (in: high G+C Gram-positive bacteria)]RUP40389.1 MAG: alpha/beta fold hydrolase [Gordonia sp. (in: high G+C Gram-positive bacteria)]HNP57094.1 alpha/beta fold hydrolase [Gordonia sp. (in: high G+C Gram-positive bacteria)]HRC49369.1 alpha/beta fold hydrolase [Gordonia sp. (in: high G+C Gram-positive bacteria)]
MTNTLRPDWVDDDLYPFTSRFADVDGHTLHHIDEGTGPTLLFVHGNPTWSFLYRDTIANLRDDFRCIAVDLPGFGLSTAAAGFGYLPADHADALTAFVDQLGISDATLVCHDWGGPISLTVATRRPNAFSRFVIANTAGWPADDLSIKLVSHALGSPIGRLLIQRFNLSVNGLLPAGHRLRKLTDGEMAHYRKALDTSERRIGSAVFPREITGSRDFLATLQASLPDLADRPALIIWGDADIAFGDDARRRWEEVFPDHETTIVKGGGHYVQSDAPEQFIGAIRDWCNRV